MFLALLFHRYLLTMLKSCHIYQSNFHISQKTVQTFHNAGFPVCDPTSYACIIVHIAALILSGVLFIGSQYIIPDYKEVCY